VGTPWWRKGRVSDLGWRGRWFDIRSSRHQMVTTWMDDCRLTGKPSWHSINTKVNSALHPSRVGKSSTGLSSWGKGGARSPVSGGR